MRQRIGLGRAAGRRPLPYRTSRSQNEARGEPLLDLIGHADHVRSRRILRSYARYYNEIRTHRSLDKDAPVTRPVQRVGTISSRAVLGGLHHRYARV